jgi:hypothetical protein
VFGSVKIEKQNGFVFSSALKSQSETEQPKHDIFYPKQNQHMAKRTRPCPTSIPPATTLHPDYDVLGPALPCQNQRQNRRSTAWPWPRVLAAAVAARA